jgi:hypothetical protein
MAERRGTRAVVSPSSHSIGRPFTKFGLFAKFSGRFA